MPSSLAATVAALLLAAPPAFAANPPGPPWPLAASPTAITLRWYPDEMPEAAAQSAAAAHCLAIGRGAALAAVERDGSAEIGTFRCR